MHKNLWSGPLAFLALGIALFIVSEYLTWEYSSITTEQRVRREEASEKYTTQSDDKIKNQCSGESSLSKMRDCIREAIETTETNKRSELDLKAQEIMAKFTRVMSVTSVVGVFIGSLSIILILATYRETRRMASITQDIGEKQIAATLRSINSAMRANELTLSQFKASTRPWITISPIGGYDIDFSLRPSAGRLKFEVKVKCVSETPVVIERFEAQLSDPEHSTSYSFKRNFPTFFQDKFVFLTKDVETTLHPGMPDARTFEHTVTVCDVSEAVFSMWPPTIVGSITYRNPQGVGYVRHFKFAAKDVGKRLDFCGGVIENRDHEIEV